MKIKFSIPNIFNEDLNLVKKVIKSGWLTHGKYTSLFEDEFKKFTNAKYCTTVSSCTAGLHLSCIVTAFKKGDEVIVPSMTHVATAHAVEHTGAKAVIADIDFKTGNLDSIRTIADVRDAVRAYYLLVTNDSIPSGSVFNIGGSHTCTVREILEKLISIMMENDLKLEQ